MSSFFGSKLFINVILPVVSGVVLLAAVAAIVVLQLPPKQSESAQELDLAELAEAVLETPEPTPTPRPAYIPDPDELGGIPNPKYLWLTDDYISAAYDSESLLVGWDTVEKADYYALCVLDEAGEVMQWDILWANISMWQIYGFSGDSVLLIAYRDMGSDSADDDTIVGAYTEQIPPRPETGLEQSAIEAPPGMPKYRVIVDKEDHAFATYTYDENLEYTVHVVTYPCATGRSSRMTPLGEFEISSKGPWKYWGGGSYSPFYTKYTGGLYFHGAIYRSKRGSSMKPRSYNEIGRNKTSGCIRTTMAGARWIYYNCPAGTIVQIVESSDLVDWPGLPEIDPEYPRWDPTDPLKPKS